MRRMLAVVLAVMMMLSLCACGGDAAKMDVSAAKNINDLPR